MTWRVHFNNGVFSASRWHKKDIMFSKNYFSAIQDGVSAHVHAVSVGASTFLTITQASFQQMLLLTSVAWHQVRNSDREPNCLKAIGCSYLQAPFCAAQKICMFFVSPFQTCNSLWHGTNYFIIICCVFCLLFFVLLTLRSRQLCPSCRLLEPPYRNLVSICFKLDVSCPSRRHVAWVDSALNGFYWQGLMW